MSRLIDNVRRVVAATNEIKESLRRKGIDVPDDAKLTDIPSIIESINVDSSTEASLMTMINGLGETSTSHTIVIGTANIGKLYDEEKAVAPSKGWTLA